MEVDFAPAPPHMGPSVPSPQLTPSRKRNHQGEIVDYPSINSSTQQQSSPLTTNPSLSTSPDLLDPSTPLTELGPTPTASPVPEQQQSDMPKKPKLTFAEKAAKQAEKEEKERLTAEVKALKEAERKRKAEEKEAARKVKEEKKREKEAEIQRKEAEALKKERAQMRIGTFFAKPAVAATPPTVSDCEDVSRGTSTTPSRRSSVGSIDMEPPLEDVKPSPSKPKPDDKAYIMPFFVKEHMQVAPFNRFLSSKAFLSYDLPLNNDCLPEMVNARFRRRRRARPTKSVKKILSAMNGSEYTPIDLLHSADPLGRVPYKFLFYREDVRPPYQGTYTKPISPQRARRLAIQPAYRGLPDIDYDYDSEAEWAEPEEGDEEVLDDDEKSVDEDADEEMDDFLDDEGDVAKRQMVVGALEPICSGLCWEGEDLQTQTSMDLSFYRMDVLHDSTTFPINPFSTTHWVDVGKKSPAKREDKPQQCATMQPPRLPLVAVDTNSGNLMSPKPLQSYMSVPGQSENTSAKTKMQAVSSPAKPIKFVPPEVLPEFTTVVSGNIMTKLGLTELLKTQFPKCTKAAIKNTLESIADRRVCGDGTTRWVLKED